MKNYGEIKNLSFKELKGGISQKTIEIHWEKLYQGYVKKWQEIQENLETADREMANASFSEFRELKIEETFTANAIILHEAYFDILGGDGNPEGEIIEVIAKNFGSFENWLKEFKSLGLASRGWAVLGYDFNEERLRNYIADAHNLYGIWGAAPILVLDVYEHAYFIDFGSDRKSYIESFFSNLDWGKINQKFQKTAKK
ncbi:MAG: superoxide dismutase [Candidatus Nealsonbacteria bacterium]|nr:superoxide dismutase [Candidatus Nealsonbacteria bacterium]